MNDSETTPLNEDTDGFNMQYESIHVKNNSLIYCMHGKNQDECCKNGNGKLERNSHCHSTEETSKDNSARQRLIGASILCLFFMIGEIIGGYFANSLAIMTDAAHLLTDFASFMISIFAIWIASRPATKQMSFGWYRAEVMGALTSVVLIWVITGILVYLAIERIVKGDYEIDATIMLLTSGIGVIVNIIMGAFLYFGGVSHGHSHGGSSHIENGNHQHQDKVNINVRAAFIHVIGDLFQSIGVLIAATIIYFQPTYHIVDPICTFMFSALVLFTTYNIIKDAVHVLMEGIPKGFDFNEVRTTLKQVPGVVEIHNLRIWSLTLDKVAMSVHLAIGNNHSPRQVLREASLKIRSKYSLKELTIQIEDYEEFMKNCGECQQLND